MVTVWDKQRRVRQTEKNEYKSDKRKMVWEIVRM